MLRLLGLPSSVTHLSISLAPAHAKNDSFKYLPTSITSLWLYNDQHLPNLDNLPPTVRHLYLSSPLSDTQTILNGPDSIYTAFAKSQSTKKLLSLSWRKHQDRYIHTSGYTPVMFSCTSFAFLPMLASMQDLQSITLGKEIILDFVILSILPPRLTRLCAHVNAPRIQPSHWPPLLADLQPTFVKNILPIDFPPRIACLWLDIPASSDLFGGYPNLRHIKSFGATDFLMRTGHPLPPSLTCLQVTTLSFDGKKQKSVLATLPRHLKRLAIFQHVSIKDLFFLPSKLTSLDIRLVPKRLHGSYRKRLPVRARELIQEGLKAGIKMSIASLKNYTCQSMNNATWVDLLPRSLTHLTIENNCTLEDDWSHLPLLRSLNSRHLTVSGVGTLPTENMRSLTIGSDQFIGCKPA